MFDVRLIPSVCLRFRRFLPSRTHSRLLVAACVLGLTASSPGVVGAQDAPTVAYVQAGPAAAGKLGDAGAPFASLADALAAGASELRIAPGVYDEGHLAFAAGTAVTLRAWPAGAGPVAIRGDVRVERGTRVSLGDERATFRLHGDLRVLDGVLDVQGNTLELDASDGRSTTVTVAAAGALIDGGFVRGTAQCGGTVRFTGADNTDLFFETTPNALNRTTTSIEVAKGTDGHLTIDLSGIPATNAAPNPPNNLDVLSLPCFTLVEAAVGEEDLAASDARGVELLGGLDVLDIGSDYTQFGGEFVMAGTSSDGPAAVQPTRQTVRVRGDFIQDDGEFFAWGALGGDVSVLGDFLLGDVLDDNEARRDVPEPGDALFSLGAEGTHTVTGFFFVGPDTDPCSGEIPDEDDACFGSATPENPALRNRYFLGGGNNVLWGDYFFAGTGDRFGDSLVQLEAQGLDGTVSFFGDAPQNVWQRQDEDAFFNDVVMSGEGGVHLQSNVRQNSNGRLLLERGIIDNRDDVFNWTIRNPEFEDRLAERNNAARDEGVVQLGSRDSYINGTASRRVEFGNATGGVITGGYLFPVGAEGEPRTDGGQTREVDFFRPLLLQFPDDLGRSSLARVDFREEITRNDVEFSSLVVPATREENEPGDPTLTLDVLGDQFWQLEFDRIPSFDPNIRVEADDLPNIFDIKSLRLVQWDCTHETPGDPNSPVIGGTNPRLAGVYDVTRGVVDDASAVLNDFINGVPNLTQEGVDVEDCQLIGIASNAFVNRLSIQLTFEVVVPFQVINATPLRIDLYFDGERLLDDVAPGSATPVGGFPQGTTTLEVTDASAADNSTPLTSATVNLNLQPARAVVVQRPGSADLSTLVLPDVRLNALKTGTTDLLLSNGVGSDLVARVTELDASTPNPSCAFDGTLGGTASAPFNACTGRVLVEFTDPATQQAASFTVDLSPHVDDALSLVVVDAVGGKSGDFDLLVFTANGRPAGADDVTAADTADDLPDAFALHGNYPNPFNPSTTLRFDLPEAAEVRVQVVDLLGRSVLTLAPQAMTAGFGRTLALDASALASGTYVYRVLAATPERTHVATGRMVLVR